MRYGKPHRSSGFSVLEILLGVAVLGILAAAGGIKLSTYHKVKMLEEEGRALFSAVAHARSVSLKKDLVCFLKLEPGSNSYGLYEDRNGNGRADPPERVSLHVLPSRIAFGSPADGPARGPEGRGVPARKVEDAWSAQMIFGNDRAAGLNDGSLYLHSTALGRRTICLRKSAAALRPELWSWDGTRWKPL